MHSVSIQADENRRTKLMVDGMDVSASCYKFVLEKNGGEFPTITLTLGCDNLDVKMESAEVETEKLTAPAATGTVSGIKE